MTTTKPRIAVSACLLGRTVRFDGGHKHNRFLAALAPFVEWVPLCPEVELGLGVPRESLRLVRAADGPRLVASRSGADHTLPMLRLARARADSLAALDIDGCIFKKDSPSCGLARVRIYDDDRMPSRTGVGLFAATLSEQLPGVPMCEEGWLHDAGLRDDFLAQLFTHHRLRLALAQDPSPRRLVAFHADHKLLYMAHSPAGQYALGRMVARLDAEPLRHTVERYRTAAMATLAVPASPGKHANVLEHILGYFKRLLAPAEKAELAAAIADARTGVEEPAVPRALLLHQLRRHRSSAWLARQVYWEPYPRAIAAVERRA